MSSWQIRKRCFVEVVTGFTHVTLPLGLVTTKSAEHLPMVVEEGEWPQRQNLTQTLVRQLANLSSRQSKPNCLEKFREQKFLDSLVETKMGPETAH